MAKNAIVLNAIKTMLSAFPALGNVSVYPDDYSDVPPVFPHIIVMELPIVVNKAMMKYGRDNWTVAIYGMIAAGKLTSPSTQEAAALTTAYDARDIIASALRQNKTLSGTVITIGNGNELFSHQIGATQWNQSPVFGFLFKVPIVGKVTGGCA